jgi:hypothetical protein
MSEFLASYCRTLHERDRRPKGGLTRNQFFLICMVCSFSWYLLPGYVFPLLSTSIAILCWAYPSSVLAHQLGSGMSGLGIGAIGLDWATVSAYLGSPLATPWFAIANVGVGFFIVMYVITPITYWGNVYNAKSFPIFSSGLFQGNGSNYIVENVIDPSSFTLDLNAYETYGSCTSVRSLPSPTR